MIRASFLVGAMLVVSPLNAQDHASHKEETPPAMDHCAMGHLPPEQCPPIDEPEGDATTADPTTADPTTDGMPDGMDHGNHGTIDHAEHGEVTDKSANGAAPETAVPLRALEGPRHAADAVWGSEQMASARSQLAREHGRMATGMVLVERLEARLATDSGEDGYLWDAQAWYGGDINRFVLKTEGEGEFGGALEHAEVQALYSRAIGPFFDLQTGVRFDPEPDNRSHLAIGIQGLAPYMFHIDGAMFISDKGDLTARVEAEYDQRITQRLILQPRIEVELSAQDIPEREVGAGISNVEPGLRLRYEIAKEFAPYVGVEYEAKVGDTAELARLRGEDPDAIKALIGLRAWF